MEGVKRFLEHIESQSTINALLILSAWMFLRIFFEGVFEATHRIGYIPFSYKSLVIYFIHYPAFYISLFIVLAAVTALISREEIVRVSRVFATGFGITLLVPIIDFIMAGGYSITYPLRIEPYLYGSINPLISITQYGGSPGQRIIFFITCVFIGLYGSLKTRKVVTGVLLFIISYFIIILLGGLPTLVAGNRPEQVYITGGILYSDTQKFSAIFVLILVCSLLMYFYLLRKDQFKLLLASLRLERAFFYGGIGIFGLLLALHQTGIAPRYQFPYIFDRIGFIILWLSLALGFQGVAALNDFFDRTGDEITRSRNPLARGIDEHHYLSWTIALVCLSLVCALLINFTVFLILFTLILLSVLYSVPPIRFKRIPLVSSFSLSVATVLAMAAGYSIIAGNAALNTMPGSIIVPTLIGVTLGFTAKDIQDIEGDRKTQIITLPLLFRMTHSRTRRIPPAIIVSASYLCYACFIHQLLPVSLLFFCITVVYTIFSPRAREWFYFLMLYMFGGYLVYMLRYLPILP